jgi:hypothetical protein
MYGTEESTKAGQVQFVTPRTQGSKCSATLRQVLQNLPGLIGSTPLRRLLYATSDRVFIAGSRRLLC